MVNGGFIVSLLIVTGVLMLVIFPAPLIDLARLGDGDTGVGASGDLGYLLATEVFGDILWLAVVARRSPDDGSGLVIINGGAINTHANVTANVATPGK